MQFPAVEFEDIKSRKAILTLKNGAKDSRRVKYDTLETVETSLQTHFLESWHGVYQNEAWEIVYHAMHQAMSEVATAHSFASFTTEKGERITNVLKKKISAKFKKGLPEIINQRKDEANLLPSYVKPYHVGNTGESIDAIKKAALTALDKAWAIAANKIRNLYFDKVDMAAFFVSKRYLGVGVFENGATCLQVGHENEMAGHFFKQYKRGKMLALSPLVDGKVDPKNNGGARCLVHFIGGHRVVLTNFYWTGMHNSRETFVEAIRKLFNFEKVSFQKIETDDVQLPVYLNHDALRVRFGERPEWKRPFIWPCPHCGDKVTHHDYYYTSGGTVELGCSRECAGSNRREMCSDCGEGFHEEEMIYSESEGELYCRACYEDRFAFCSCRSGCGEILTRDAIQDSHGNLYDQDCPEIQYCEECGEAVHDRDVEHAHDASFCSTRCVMEWEKDNLEEEEEAA